MTAEAPLTDEITETIDVVSAWLDDVRAVVAAGATVDLSGLEKQVSDICAAVNALPPERGRALLPELEALMANLSRLWSLVQPIAPAGSLAGAATAYREAADKQDR